MCIRDSSNTHKLANTFRKHKYKIAYRTNNTIKKHINDTNTDIDKYNKTGVYKLNCNNCNSFYIGQTGRSFSSRYSEPVSYTHLDVYKRQHLGHVTPTEFVFIYSIILFPCFLHWTIFTPT